ALPLEHMVGEHVLLRKHPIRLDLRRVDVLIRKETGWRAASAAEVNEIEAVHLPAVVLFDERLPLVRDVVRILEGGLPETHDSTGMSNSGRRAVGAWKRGKEVVETAIFLHDDHDVFNPPQRPAIGRSSNTRRREPEIGGRLRGSTAGRRAGEC